MRSMTPSGPSPSLNHLTFGSWAHWRQPAVSSLKLVNQLYKTTLVCCQRPDRSQSLEVGKEMKSAHAHFRDWKVKLKTRPTIENLERTASQNLNPLRTSPLGSFTPLNVSSQKSKASSLACRTPSAFASTTAPPYRWTNPSRYTLIKIPYPVLTSVWNGKDNEMSSRSSRCRRAWCCRNMFSAVDSINVLSARDRDRTNELNTNSSRERGPDHCCGCVHGKRYLGSPRVVPRLPNQSAHLEVQRQDAQNPHNQ